MPLDPDFELDSPMTAEEASVAAALTPAQLAVLDRTLYGFTAEAPRWRKLAFVVGQALFGIEGTLPPLADVFLAQRVAGLVDQGYLRAAGDLRAMRFSEVQRTDRTFDGVATPA